MGELPTLAPASTNIHGRPSIAGLNTPDTQDNDDGTPASTVQVVDASANKSPVNVSGSKYRLPIIFRLDGIISSFTLQ